METQLNSSFEYTPTWIVACICFLIVFVSLCAERGLHRLGKFLKRGKHDALFEALQKLKEELMLMGFISLLLTAFQGPISRICMPAHLAYHMLPCKRHSAEANAHHILPINNKRLLLSVESESGHCPRKGQIPLLTVEALHQLHIFIFVLALVHVIFCATTMVLGGARIRQWKRWEDSIRREISRLDAYSGKDSKTQAHNHLVFVKEHTQGYWRKAAVISWMIAFFKQFYDYITKADYIALRLGFIEEHVPGIPKFDFQEYLTRTLTLEVDFKKIVGISWYLWLFVVLFLLLNLEGWHAYFWLSFLPLILLLLVGAKLAHILTQLAQEQQVRLLGDKEAEEGGARAPVKPSDEHFWFGRPALVLYLIHFILFQNSFEIAFFFWIWSTYGFKSCIMEKIGFIVTRLIIGVVVQVLCSYSTLPLYAIVTQMGTTFKKGRDVFIEMLEPSLLGWGGENRMKKEADSTGNAKGEASRGTSEIVQALKIGDAPLQERQQE